MRKIVSWMFVTLDGVMESPEKWVMFDESMGEAIDAEAAAADTLLLGRRTYDVFAASWPNRTAADDPHTDWMNETPKLVASTTVDTVTWQNSALLDGDVPTALAEHKRRPGDNILVNGSATLVRTLLSAGLLDELRLFVHPIVRGHGAKLFHDGASGHSLHLAEARPFTNGVLSVLYQPSETQAR